MQQVRPFTADDATWVRGYCEEVGRRYRELLGKYNQTFVRSEVLLNRLVLACESVIANGWTLWAGIESVHNELAVAAAIFGNGGYEIRRVEYEAPAQTCARSVDFHVAGEDGDVWLVDVKTIAPELRDRWSQFEHAKDEGWFTPNTKLAIFEEWLGGEIWHSKAAARARMLEYTLELEAKLADCYPDCEPLGAVLVFCSNGFHWHEDELEDFVSFYVQGAHRPDDPLAAMETHFIRERNINLPRRVKRFAYLQRESLALVPSRINWRVIPPRFPGPWIPEGAA